MKRRKKRASEKWRKRRAKMYKKRPCDLFMPGKVLGVQLSPLALPVPLEPQEELAPHASFKLGGTEVSCNPLSGFETLLAFTKLLAPLAMSGIQSYFGPQELTEEEMRKAIKMIDENKAALEARKKADGEERAPWTK